MGAAQRELRRLADELVEEVRGHGIREVSLGQYRCVCNSIARFAEREGETSWSDGLAERYLAHTDGMLAGGAMCAGYHRFQRRVVRMLGSLADGGEVDFSPAPSRRPAKYPVTEDRARLVEEILGDARLGEGTRSDLRAPVRHLLWYAQERGVAPLAIDDALVMGFLVEEVPRTNSGSAGRTLRAVRLAAGWLGSHGGAVTRDYSLLTLRDGKRRIIPAHAEAEVRAIVGAIDASTDQGRRDRAIVLLAYCTGLRGCDVLSLRLDEVDWRNQTLTTTQSKTHSPITCALNGETMNALADYVLEARPDCGLPEVFLTVHSPARPMRGRDLAKMLDRICERAGVEKLPGRSFHSLRRAFETTLVSRGVAVETASQMVGHRTIAEDKPYITHDRRTASLVAMGFGDVPIAAGPYARRVPGGASRAPGAGSPAGCAPRSRSTSAGASPSATRPSPTSTCPPPS